MGKWILMKNRILKLINVHASELKSNPKNWRKHPEKQKKAMIAALKEVGFVGAVLAYEDHGSLVLIDGHLRVSLAKDEEIPCIVLDVKTEEADKILATYDSIQSLADEIKKQKTKLLRSIKPETLEFRKFVADLLGDTDEETELREIPLQQPPEMSWVLVGIETVRFLEIARTIEVLSDVENIIIETTVSNVKSLE